MMRFERRGNWVKLLLMMALLVTMLAMGLAGCGLFPEEEEVLEVPLSTPKAQSYTTAAVSRDTIENTVTMSGSIQSRKKETLCYTFDGRFEEYVVTLGQEVKAGDVIARLDMGSLETQLKQAQLTLASQQLSYQDAQNARSRAGRDLPDAQAKVEETYNRWQTQLRTYDEFVTEYKDIDATIVSLEQEIADCEDRIGTLNQSNPDNVDIQAIYAQMRTAKSKLAELEEVVNRGFNYSAQENEQYQLVLNAKSAYDSAQTRVRSIQDSIADQGQSLERAKLSLESAQMNVDNLKEQITKTELVAPFDGVIETIDATLERGDNVGAYQDIAVLYDPTDVQIASNAGSNADILTTGMVGLMEFEGKQVECTIVSSPSDFNANNFTAEELEIMNKFIFSPSEPLEGAKVGKTVSVSILLEKAEDVLVIPERALRSSQGRSYVLVLEGETKRDITIEVGLKGSTVVEVREGLEEGQLVILQ